MAMTRYQQWPVHVAVGKEVKQALNALFENTRQTDDAHRVAARWAPAVDVKEEPNQFTVFADLPGIDQEHVQVQMDQGVLSIQGERAEPTAPESGGFSCLERAYGRFYRSFTLPDTVDTEAISAKMRHGVLEICLPKKPAAASRQIQVS